MDILHRASKCSHLPFFGTGIRTLGVLSVIGLFIALLVFPSSAVADDMQDAVDQAQSQLSAAEAQMEAIVADYHATEAEAESMQTRIDETAAAASQAQQAVNEGRDELGLVALSQYRASDSSLMLSLLLNATSFDDLLRQVTYFDAVMQQKADLIAEQKERVEQYNQLISELNAQKDAQDAKLAELEERRTEAQTLVENAQSQLTNAQGEQASRLAALAAASESLGNTTTQEETTTSFDPSWNTFSNDSTNNSNSNSNSSPSPSPTPTPTPTPNNNTSDDSTAGWKTGIASAYGGSSDPSTPNPGTTATGARCDDNSMGVAVPMSLPGYRSLFGHTVEIKYGGKTVLATINDCGGMGNGSRALDLQPGVFKSFGASTCQAWGLRTVSYRIL